MWQRFTESARKVVYYAQEHAIAQGARQVTAEHLLRGILVDENSVACKIIKGLGVETDQLRQELSRRAPQGEVGRKGDDDMSLSSDAMRAIDLAYDETQIRGDNYLGTEHLLLGVLREASGKEAKFLESVGLTLLAARAKLDSWLAQHEPQDAVVGTTRGSTAADLDDLIPRTATIRFHPAVPAELVQEFLKKLADLYRACGGAGFTIDWDEEKVLTRGPAHV